MNGYTDRPTPGRGYWLVFLCGPGVVFALCALVELALGGNDHALLLIAMPAWTLCSVVLLHTATHTTYHLDQGLLEVRMGWLKHRTVPLAEIAAVHPVGLLPARDYCNRFQHGVRITAAGRRDLYLTPSTLAVFQDQLRAGGCPC